MKYTVVSILSLLALLTAAQMAGGAEPAEIARELCHQTVAALKATQSKPLAELLSQTAGVFLATAGEQVLKATKATLQKADKYADRPLLSEKAALGDVQASDRMYALQVRAKVKDGQTSLLMHGIALREMGKWRWLMVAVVPEEKEEEWSDEETEVMQALTGWGEALAAGDTGGVLRVMDPEGFSLSVVGPDYGFYVFSGADELETALMEATAQGRLRLAPAGQPRVHAKGKVAIVEGPTTMTVGDMIPVELDTWVHLRKTEEGWRIVGFSGLPQVK